MIQTNTIYTILYSKAPVLWYYLFCMTFSVVFYLSSLICDYNLVETWNSPLIFPSLLLPNPPTTSRISSLL